MVELLHVDRVQYVWDEETGNKLPLCYLYFCKYCLDIRSADNLLHEIDSHYCPQTLDGVSTTEAALKKNKSNSCFQCPACPSLLSTRTTSIVLPDPDDPSKQTVKKAYYLVCTFCRWSTRDIGMEDKASGSGWTEREMLNAERVNKTIDYYKRVAQKEVADTKNAKRRGYKSLVMQLQQKYHGRKPHPASPLSAITSRVKEFEEIELVDIPAQLTYSIQDMDPVPEEIYTKNVDFMKLSSIGERLAQPEHVAVNVTDLVPQKATMFVKRSLRCKECQHNLIKPEYHPTSIKFKMQLVAIHYVPEIRIHREPVLKLGERTRVTLVIINRTDHPSHVTLSRMHPENLKYETAKSMCELPSTELIISRFEEIDLLEEHGKTKDDASEIAFRNSNEVGFYIWVSPSEDLEEGDDVWISFNMKYDYRNNISVLLQSKNTDKPVDPEIHWLCNRIYVNLGVLKSSD